VTTSPPDRDELGVLARKIARFGEPVSAAIESMNGARYIHDTLELLGWDVEIASPYLGFDTLLTVFAAFEVIAAHEEDVPSDTRTLRALVARLQRPATSSTEP
jgi:hypothetical protein